MNPVDQIKQIAESKGFSVTVSKKIPEMLEIEYIELHRQKKEIEKKLQDKKNEILELYSSDDPIQGEKINIIYVKPTKILDTEKLKAEMPNIYEFYLIKEKKGFYSIKIKGEEK